ncbi:hypothetical protein AGMMS49938_00310 [Fibrobacterales bacterium]|nr:hypothetical protein AGMMS49938_00310 [Fibrobacterales bacterium]
MKKKSKRFEIRLYSKGTGRPVFFSIPVRVIFGWVLGLAIIIPAFIFWLPENMLHLKNLRVIEVSKEQKTMQLTANKLEKQISEADVKIEDGHNLRFRINQLAGIRELHKNDSSAVNLQSMNFTRVTNSLKIFSALRDSLVANEQLAAALPLLHPVKRHQNITNRFGIVQDPLTKRELTHRGIDFAVRDGDTIIATGNGIADSVLNRKSGLGTTLVIKHSPHIESAYSHLQAIFVKAGSHIKKGQAVAIAGRSGSVNWPVLHYEVRYDGQPINPENYFITP